MKIGIHQAEGLVTISVKGVLIKGIEIGWKATEEIGVNGTKNT
jgi:hypothetical protein